MVLKQIPRLSGKVVEEMRSRQNTPGHLSKNQHFKHQKEKMAKPKKEKMAKPKKKRGFRKIKVEGQDFNWRFSGQIDVRPEGKKNNKLLIEFGWYDVWLLVGDPNKSPDSASKQITPKFVSESIKFAMANGWDTSKAHSQFQLNFKEKKYSVQIEEQES